MEAILAVIILAAIGFLLYLFMPIYTKKAQIIYFSILLVSLLAILVIPNDWICNIPIIVFNKSINQMIADFCQKSDHLQNLIAFAPMVKVSLTLVVQNMVKGLAVCFVLGLTTLVAAIVFFIVDIIKHNKVMFSIISLLICIVISASLMFVPITTVSTLYADLNNNAAKKGEKVYETYDGFEDYMVIFNILDTVSDKVNGLGISAPFNYIGNAFNFYSFQKLSHDLNQVDPLLTSLRDAGITIIYTNPSFHFRDTTQSTFNFEKINDTVADCLNTSVYYDVARSFANKIMNYFEEHIENDTGKTDVDLQFSHKQFKEQYGQLLELLKFVVDYNLVNSVNSFGVDKIPNMLGALVGGLGILTNLSKYQIVTRIQSYMNFARPESAAIYTCMILYQCLDSWLDDYRLTPMHDTSLMFLQAREII